MFYLIYKTSYLNKEVNGTEPSFSVRVPWTNRLAYSVTKKKSFPMLTPELGQAAAIERRTQADHH
jgi:hypothetical protein